MKLLRLSNRNIKMMELYKSHHGNECPEWWEGVITVSLEAAKECENERKELQHYKDSLSGLYCTDKKIEDLLHLFWQRKSDACPLECSEAEKQEKEFAEFVKTISFRL